MQEWSYKMEIHKPLGPGQLLLAEPFMPDENFRRTVVLLCKHDEINGSVGFVINRPIQLTLSDLISMESSVDYPVRLGGPVGTDSIQCIHGFRDIPGTIGIHKNLFWGGDFDVIKKRILQANEPQPNVLFFLGYSGWGANQLKEEIQDSSWIVTPLDDVSLFTLAPDSLWKNILFTMGGPYAEMANYPEDPELN